MKNLTNNYEKAFHWLSLSAQQKNIKAQFMLGELYALGKGTEKNEHTAYEWYLRSALQGYPRALRRIHNLYHAESNMFCRGMINAAEQKWIQPKFKKKNNIRELFEYRAQQLELQLTTIKSTLRHC
jgi:TPR repeat protein